MRGGVVVRAGCVPKNEKKRLVLLIFPSCLEKRGYIKKKRVYSHMISHMKDLKHTFLICNVGSVTPYPQQNFFSPFLSPYLFYLQTNY